VLSPTALDSHHLDPKANLNENNEQIKKAVIKLLADDAFLLGEDEKVHSDYKCRICSDNMNLFIDRES
jgi:hypothetical protein